MSTRCVFTFKDQDGNAFHVYKHYDGYPSGAVDQMRAARPHTWSEDRFAAAEFAAAFIAGNKGQGGGNVYLSKGPQHHSDLDFSYTVSDSPEGIRIKAFEFAFDFEENVMRREKIFDGLFKEFEEIYGDELV